MQSTLGDLIAARKGRGIPLDWSLSLADKVMRLHKKPCSSEPPKTRIYLTLEERSVAISLNRVDKMMFCIVYPGLRSMWGDSIPTSFLQRWEAELSTPVRTGP